MKRSEHQGRQRHVEALLLSYLYGTATTRVEAERALRAQGFSLEALFATLHNTVRRLAVEFVNEQS